MNALADPDLDSALDAALNQDATLHLDVPPPPKREPWINEDGSARWGYKDNGEPRRAAPGPGRGGKKNPDDQPRAGDGATPPVPPSSPAGAAGPAGEEKDYTPDLIDTGLGVWMAISSIGMLVPAAHAVGAVWNPMIPQMAGAANQAAQHNKKARQWVEKMSGEGGFTWVIPVTAAVAGVVLGVVGVLRDPVIRANAIEANQVMFSQYLQHLTGQRQSESSGADSEPPTTTSPASPSEASSEPEPEDPLADLSHSGDFADVL